MKLLNKDQDQIAQLEQELQVRRPLPIGKTQFEEWADRIIEGAMVEATEESQKNALAAMLMHLGPTEAFKEDGFFVLQLRKGAVNETAHAMMMEFKEAKEKRKQAEDTAPNLGVVNGVLAEQGI